MKKFLIILSCVLGLSLTAAAQPRAVGLRFPAMAAFGAEFSYQHEVGNAQFIEFELGLERYNGFRTSGLWNWELANPEWTAEGAWTLYGGGGITLGFVEYDRNGNFGYMGGLTAQLGLEYRFEFPLALSVDLRPTVGLCHGFYRYGTYGLIPNISARYYF